MGVEFKGSGGRRLEARGELREGRGGRECKLEQLGVRNRMRNLVNGAIQSKTDWKRKSSHGVRGPCLY